jgi:hypothetical protein
MKRQFRVVRFFVLALLVAGVAVGGAAGGMESNAVTFTDPSGDSGSAADITAVEVSNDDSGVIRMRVSVPNRPTADQLREVLVISINNDPNATNDRSGYGEGDVALFATSEGVFTRRFQGSTLVPFDAPSLRAEYSSGPAFSFNRADFGISSRFAFFIQVRDRSASVRDDAPDGAASYVYVVTVGPPPLAAGTVTAAPRAPVHGKAFSFRMPVMRTDNNTALPDDGVSVSCAARIRAKTLRGRGSYTGGVAKCIFAIPKASRGKSFDATITVRFEGATIGEAFTSRIR